MTGLDTNVLVRLLVRDDRVQARRAFDRMKRGPLFVSKSVLLETSWVLLRLYGFAPKVAQGALRRLLGLEHLQVEDRAAVVRALRWWEQGLDFADALHLASGEVDEFVTFDAALVAKGKRLESAPTVAQP